MWKLLWYLPRKKLSQIVGQVMHWQAPEPLRSFMINTFAQIYRINTQEAERPTSSYLSIGDFFVRKLKPGTRPLGSSVLVHCADAKILQQGEVVEGGFCIQAKGLKYPVNELLVDPEWQHKYAGGAFLTYYLCPTDYHRIHSPVAGFIRQVTYVPGDLWPVHEAAVKEIRHLYCVNERVIIELATEFGAVAVVLVGATNVGHIELNFDREIRGNHDQPFTQKIYKELKPIAKGEELGMFKMGSTVVVILSESYAQKIKSVDYLNKQVKVNSSVIP